MSINLIAFMIGVGLLLANVLLIFFDWLFFTGTNSFESNENYISIVDSTKRKAEAQREILVIIF